MASRSLVLALLLAAPLAAFAAGDAPKLKVVTHCVADLVVPIQPLGKGPVQTTDAKLIRLIESIVSPETWQSTGGAGSVEYFPLTMSLIVCQTPEVQEQVQELLASLRRNLDTEVAVELRFISVPTEMMEKLGLTGDEKECPSLDDSQVRLLLEAVQECPHANVMQAPKVVMFNGQKAHLDLTEQQMFVVGVDFETKDGKQVPKPIAKRVKTGFEIAMLPTIDPRREKVTLQLAVEYYRDEPAKVGRPIDQTPGRSVKLEKTLKLADGKTALLTAWTTQREVRNEFGPPILSRVPYVNRLFKNVGYGREEEKTLVLVTPRVIFHKEEDDRLTAYADPNEASKPVEAKTEARAVFVNKKSFSLTYELTDVGSSKVKEIEVWVTKNEGQTWTRYPEAVKPAGEVPITVPSEGRYGFRLVPRSGVGLAGPTPKSGDAPQAVVVVDCTPPNATLYKVEPRADGVVHFQWKASDELQLAAEPVKLYWSEKAEGPWELIPHQHAAMFDGGFTMGEMPPSCYFRLTATDAAGNVAVAITREPVALDTKVPQARNISVKVKVSD